MKNLNFKDVFSLCAEKYPSNSYSEVERMAHIVIEICEKENESPARALQLEQMYEKYWDKYYDDPV